MYLIISRTCWNCGDKIAVKLQANTPIEKEIDEVRNKLGGMFCISSKVIALVPEVITIPKED